MRLICILVATPKLLLAPGRVMSMFCLMITSARDFLNSHQLNEAFRTVRRAPYFLTIALIMLGVLFASARPKAGYLLLAVLQGSLWLFLFVRYCQSTRGGFLCAAALVFNVPFIALMFLGLRDGFLQYAALLFASFFGGVVILRRYILGLCQRAQTNQPPPSQREMSP